MLTTSEPRLSTQLNLYLIESARADGRCRVTVESISRRFANCCDSPVRWPAASAESHSSIDVRATDMTVWRIDSLGSKLIGGFGCRF